MTSIPGIGPVFADGSLRDLTWSDNTSDQVIPEDNYLTRTGNTYLRDYISEAINIVRDLDPKYAVFYKKDTKRLYS